MYGVSDSFKQAIINNHTMVVRCEVLDSTGKIVKVLQINEGNVDVEKDNEIRRRFRLTLTDPTDELTPRRATDLLSPATGNEIRLWRGIGYPLAIPELVPQGVFGISDCQIHDSGQSFHIELSGYDRSRKVARAGIHDYLQFADGTNVATAIRTLIETAYPTAQFNFAPTIFTTPLITLEPGANPWKEATKLAESIGNELFFNMLGICVLRPEPDPDTAPIVWTYDEGAEATFLYLSKRLSDEDTFNHIVVLGEGSTMAAPVFAHAHDDNPASPTYIDGPYGSVLDVFKTNLAKTTEQAQVIADARLAANIGTIESINFPTVANPAHEINDIIAVRRAKSKVDARYVIDSMNLPLNYSGVLNITTRKRRI